MKDTVVKMILVIVAIFMFCCIENPSAIAATNEIGLMQLVVKNENIKEQKERIVYTTKTGKCYHFKSSCPRGKVFSTTLSKVKRTALRPCSKCCH